MPARGRSWWAVCTALAVASTAVAPSSAMAYRLIVPGEAPTACVAGASCGSGTVQQAIPNSTPLESSPGAPMTRTLPSSTAPAQARQATPAAPRAVAAPTAAPNPPSAGGVRTGPPPGAGPAQGGQSSTGTPMVSAAPTPGATGETGSTGGWNSAYSPSTGPGQASGQTPGSNGSTGYAPQPPDDEVASETEVDETVTPTPTTAPTGGTVGSGTTAAAAHGWGTPNRVDEFTDGSLAGWGLYDGTGHDGNGRRSPSAISVRNGVLTITGSANGTTGGMAWGAGQRYGRWEGRVRTPAGDADYHSLLLLWPDAEDWPRGGEVDFMEISDPSRQSTDGFLHYGADNSQLYASVDVDATQWHNWAVEWTPSRITYFVDGQAWFTTTQTSAMPPGLMHLCIQLDWFPSGGGSTPSSMEVDWVRYYPLR